jgi:macrolide transport system ATP-binding/permease protein
MFTTLTQDVRFALRQLRKTPGFTATAILTLALGIGANAAIFTLVNAVMLRNLPVADPKTLLRLGDNDDCCVNGGGPPDDGNYTLFSTEVYEYFKTNAPEFEELAAMQAGFTYRPVTVRRESSREEARSVSGEFVTGNYFRTFGLRPAAGGFFNDSDDTKGAPLRAVMSYDTWQNQYAADPSIVGSTFFVNTKPVTITGIAPPGFYGDRLAAVPPNFYFPMETMLPIANAPYVHDREARWLYLIGRIRPGVSQPALQAKLSTLLKQVVVNTKYLSSQDHRDELARAHIVLTPGGTGIQNLQSQYASHLRLLMWIAGLVLLIACANIANLVLVRGMSRKAEMSVRTALGAMRRRIVGQLLTESVVLALLSGFAGLFVAYAGTKMLLALAFPGAERLPIDASPSTPVLVFGFALSMITGIAFGMAPAWLAAQSEPADALRSSPRTTAGGATVLQRGLVILQAALSLILLLGAGLFSKSLSKLQNTDLKLETRNRYIVHINPQAAGYSQRQVEALYRTIEARFHQLPGIERVGISTYTPMEDNNFSTGVQVQGQPLRNLAPSVTKINPEYFDSVGTHVLAGRGVTVQDTATSRTVAVINETFRKKFFEPDQNPIGQHFGAPEDTGDYEIVGVVEDTAYTSARWKDHMMFFVPLVQRPASDTEPIEQDEGMYAGAVVVKTAQPISDMEAIARRTLSSINPNLSVVKFQTFDAQIADRFSEDHMLARLTVLFGALALLLATIGLYGVTAYAVARRTSEIGIRMALGAERMQVTTMVMRGAIVQAAIGLILGIPIAMLCVRFVEAQLYEIKGIDAGTLILAIATLASAAAVAGLIPARKAAAIDPAQALRSE